jgi:hypothetical protein
LLGLKTSAPAPVLHTTLSGPLYSSQDMVVMTPGREFMDLSVDIKSLIVSFVCSSSYNTEKRKVLIFIF